MPNFATLADAVAYYNSKLQTKIHVELEICRYLIHDPCFTPQEIANALLRCKHQFRLPNTKKNALINALATHCPWRRTYRDFEELYESICSLFAAAKIGAELTRYDVAKRIGYALGCPPVTTVYLWADPYDNAGMLLAAGLRKRHKMPVSAFAMPLALLGALDIEHFACIIGYDKETGRWNLPEHIPHRFSYNIIPTGSTQTLRSKIVDKYTLFKGLI